MKTNAIVGIMNAIEMAKNAGLSVDVVADNGRKHFDSPFTGDNPGEYGSRCGLAIGKKYANPSSFDGQGAAKGAGVEWLDTPKDGIPAMARTFRPVVVQGMITAAVLKVQNASKQADVDTDKAKATGTDGVPAVRKVQVRGGKGKK